MSTEPENADEWRLLSDYHAASEPFDAASATLIAHLSTGTAPTPTEIHIEEVTRARLLVARKLLWSAWRDG